MSWRVSLLFPLLFLFSCGYHNLQKELFHRPESFSLGFVKEDRDGQFTKALIYEMTQRLPLNYVNTDADFILEAKILSYREENTSYSYDPLLKKAYGNEKRAYLAVECSLVDGVNGKELLAPRVIKVDQDFDFHQDPSSAIYKANLLGILEMGQEASKEPLYEAMAQKITDYLLQHWPL